MSGFNSSSFLNMSGRIPPLSCDTFAVLPPGTPHVVFGKNSDRPSDEVQEVIYRPAADHNTPSKLKCTYIEVDQVDHTHAVILSKPAWMWGAEMGANEHDVCIGNEAVWTVLNDDSDADEKLLGMDLLRLALERGETALKALEVIVGLIEEYGMGGNCSDTLTDFTYHNSFLIADPVEVWILECAGTIWAAEKVVAGVRNISNELSIGTQIDLKCSNLEEFAGQKKLWDSKSGSLNFKRCFGMDDCDSHRYISGKRLLSKYSEGGQFAASDMFKVLRDKPSGICMSSGSFVSTGSQVSVLRKGGSVHWFTATPDPATSVFKPFCFAENVEFPMQVVSPVLDKMTSVDRRHELYKRHGVVCGRGKSTGKSRNMLSELEVKYLKVVEDISVNFDTSVERVRRLFKDAVEEECNLYGAI